MFFFFFRFVLVGVLSIAETIPIYISDSCEILRCFSYHAKKVPVKTFKVITDET
jgi:hypothetical protein